MTSSLPLSPRRALACWDWDYSQDYSEDDGVMYGNGNLGYSHFQPQPQPLPFPGAHLLAPQPQCKQGQAQHGMGVGITAGDFELFAPPAPASLAGYRPCPPALAPRHQQQAYPIPIPSSASSTSSHADNDYPPLPDLVADEGASTASFSPPSPRFASPVRPSLYRMQGDGSYRGERAASVPVPDPPRYIRRKTQESRDWPSFYSSGSSSTSSSMSSSAYLPTAPGGYVDEPASYATPTAASAQGTNPFDAANLVLSPAAQYGYYQPAPAPPHTDHPLLASEQSDLLRRVQRDLVDVDLASIKGPLRALALSGDREATPLAMVYPPMSPARVPAPPAAAQLTPKGALLRSPAAATVAEDALSAGTVSPQEAFLDYDEVDSRLHDPADPLYAAGRDREFGVGVGASLFAPLPTVAAEPSAGPSAFAPSPLRERSTTPTTAGASTTLASPLPAAPLSPKTAAAPHHPARRGPHPFSVPQNAVTWAERRSRSGQHLVGGVVDGDADDDDGDFGSQDAEEDDDESEARAKEAVRKQAGLGSGFGAFDVRDVDLKPAQHGGEPAAKPSEEERARYGLDDVGKPLFGVPPSALPSAAVPPAADDESKPRFLSAGSVAGKSLPRAGAPAAAAGYAPPPPLAGIATPLAMQFAPPAPAPPSGVSAFQHELQKQKALGGTTSGTSTPRRAAAASALAGLNAFPELYGAASTSAPAAPATRPARERKRSRAARAMYGNESDEAGGAAAAEDDDGGDESDASYHSSASSFAGTGGGRGGTGGGLAPKRRRRAPGAATSGSSSSRGGVASAGAGSGSIRCDHQNSDGTTCGVIFRRPYDLARHRETIHNESLGGEKLKTVKEWRCPECDGTFSRKDALIRHCRIRNHRAG